jgi:integrase
MRERRPGVWEVRVALGPDLISGRTAVRSLTVHGDRMAAELARARWAAQAALVRSTRRARPGITVGELLEVWLAAEHAGDPRPWPGTGPPLPTWSGTRWRRGAPSTCPRVLRAACAAWGNRGWPDPAIWARVRVLRSALGWAHAERVLDRHPLDGMRGPPQSGIRQHAPVETVRAIIEHAVQRVATTADLCDGTFKGRARLHRAEQLLLLARLAADYGARRGELAALQFDDLDGDVLTIARGTSNEVVGPTKTGRSRRLTLGATTAALWRDTARTWRQRLAGQPVGPWLFSADVDHSTRLTTSALGHWFAALAADAGHPDVTLHRLRHTVATTLVGCGDILGAQHRLGHRDASTTLRIYSHAMPLTDANAADTLDRLYR